MVQYVRLGSTGMEVSRTCLGMMSFSAGGGWHLDEQQAESIVKAAVDGGVTFFDTADAYADGSSEQITGALLPRFLRRDDMVVATKVFNRTGPGRNDRGLSRKHILSAIDASLTRLGMDYVDLYQLHRFDPETPVEETMEALNDVVRAGKVRYLGASTMWVWQFLKLQRAAEVAGGAKFVAMQNHYNLLYREEEREMIPACVDQGVGVICYSPLARGLLAGNRSRDGRRLSTRADADALGDRLAGAADFDVIDRVREVAASRGVSSAQVAMAWLYSRAGVTAPIIGATSIGHVTDAIDALNVQLSPEEMTRLEDAYQPRTPIGLT